MRDVCEECACVRASCVCLGREGGREGGCLCIKSITLSSSNRVRMT